MLMAIIEYALNPGAEDEFQALVGSLSPRLGEIDGFLGADAASSLLTAGYLYEISWWRDEAALAVWSRDPEHLHAKLRGRQALLKWYRVRVGPVAREMQFGEIPGARDAG